MPLKLSKLEVSNEYINAWEESMNLVVQLLGLQAIFVLRKTEKSWMAIAKTDSLGVFENHELLEKETTHIFEDISKPGAEHFIFGPNDVFIKEYNKKVSDEIQTFFVTSLFTPQKGFFGYLCASETSEKQFSELEISLLKEIKLIIEKDLCYLKQEKLLINEINERKEIECELNAVNEELKAGLERKHTEIDKISKDLKDIEEDYKLIVENQNALIVKFDKDFKLTYISPQYAKELGSESQSLIGKSFYPFIHKDDIEQVRKSHQDLKKPPYECHHEERMKTVNGWRWYFWSNKSIVNEAGEVEGVVAVGRDVTQRKKVEQDLKESEEKNRVLSEATEEALFFSDKGICVECNKAACEMFGYRYEELIGILGTDVIAEESKEIVYQYMMCGYEEPYEAIAQKKDGTKFWAEFHGRMYNYKGKQVRLTAVRDISEKKVAEEALIFSEEKFRAAFKTSPDSISINRMSDGKYVEINEGFMYATGFSENEILGKTAEDLNFWVYQSDKLKLLAELKRNGYCVNFAAKFRLKNEKIINGLLSARIITIKEENYLISITRDISELKVAENELIAAKEFAEKKEKEYRSLFNEMLDGFALHQVIYNDLDIPVDYRFIELNPAYERLTGLKKEEVVNKTVLEVTPDIEKHWIANFGKVGKTGEPFWFEDFSKDHDLCYRGIAYSPRQDYFAVIFSDVTDKKKAEKIVIENDRLLKERNIELTELNMELLEAKQKAEESDKLKTAFLANMSHEIRTPMNGIMGFSGLLAKDNLTGEKRNKYIGVIKQNSNQLLSIINDLVDISKIEAGQIDIEKNDVKLDLLTRSIADLYHQKAINKNIYFELENEAADIRVNTDETKLRQILINLLDNAFKFTPEGEIKFGYKLIGGFVEFFVSDTGIGIDKDSISVIFERFRQVELSSARKYGGTGLGLSISKAYVEKMGGKIWVNSEINKGSKFVFTIPLELSSQNIAQIHEDQLDSFVVDWSDKVILVAEDELVNYRFFEEIFESTKVNLIWAVNGQEAIDHCVANESIDLVLMDMKMPVLNGYDATRKIKEIKPGLPIIAQTAYALIGDETKARNAGCDDYIHKPIDTDELMKKIANFLT